MEKLNSFFEFLNKFISISEEEFTRLLIPIVSLRKFPKKFIVLEEGDKEEYFNFILKGLVRKYYKKGKEEINTQISYEGQVIHSQESFYSHGLSEYYIETMEPTIFVSITHNDLENLFAGSKKMEYLGRKVITYAMVIKDNWQIKMIKYNPRERFIDFVSKNPELIQRVPQKLLASLLRIKPETFSRFKHLIRPHVKSGLS